MLLALSPRSTAEDHSYLLGKNPANRVFAQHQLAAAIAGIRPGLPTFTGFLVRKSFANYYLDRSSIASTAIVLRGMGSLKNISQSRPIDATLADDTAVPK